MTMFADDMVLYRPICSYEDYLLVATKGHRYHSAWIARLHM